MKVPCRGCGTLLDLSETGCPICLRGRSPQEIANDARRLREQERLARQRPWKIAGGLAAAAALAALAVRFQEPLSRAVGAATGAVSGAFEKIQDPRYYAPQSETPPPDAPAPVEPPPAAASPAPVAPRPASVPAHAAAEAPAGPERALTWQLPAWPEDQSGMGDFWRVQGFVYDLESAKPMMSVTVRFTPLDESGPRVEARTDSLGAYAVRLARQRQYRAQVIAPGYLTGPLEDGDPPYRAQARAERVRAAKVAREYSSESATLTWNDNLDEVRQDLVVVKSAP
jgi:hypothetical protein